MLSRLKSHHSRSGIKSFAGSVRECKKLKGIIALQLMSVNILLYTRLENICMNLWDEAEKKSISCSDKKCRSDSSHQNREISKQTSQICVKSKKIKNYCILMGNYYFIKVIVPGHLCNQKIRFKTLLTFFPSLH